MHCEGANIKNHPAKCMKLVLTILVLSLGKVVLKNLHLEIPGGKTTAIVGPSGSGKTTIAQLLMRIYDVTSGQIIVDGKYKLKDLDLKYESENILGPNIF